MTSKATSLVRAGIVASLGALAVGCAAGSDTPTRPLVAPHIAGFARYSATIGQPIEVYGTGFADPYDIGAEATAHFIGTFTDDQGHTENVDRSFPLRYVDGGTVEWSTFGPYANPFGLSSPRIGTFQGTIQGELVGGDGTVQKADDHPVPISFRVQPSVAIEDFEPTTASCNAPVLRGLAGAPYRLSVRALGFTAAAWDYTVSVPSVPGITDITIHHAVRGATDTVGNSNELRLPDVPAGLQSYMVVISIVATDTNGAQHQTAFATGVHKPIEIYYNGNIQIAEILPPTPVSACIPGGNESRTVSYDEMTSETRTRRLDIGWNSNWLNSHTTTTGTDTSHMTTDGTNQSNSTGVSTTDGQTFGWNYEMNSSNTIGGQAGFQGIFFNAGGHFDHTSGSSSGTNGTNMSSVTDTRNAEFGLSHSESTTETHQASESNMASVGGGMTMNITLEVSSSTSDTRSFQGFIPAHEFGVFYRQTTRLVRRGLIVVYNLCGNPQVVGNADFNDWAWAPDLGVAPSCPPLPASNLPPAHCYTGCN